jgi:hypothetical protein
MGCQAKHQALTARRAGAMAIWPIPLYLGCRFCVNDIEP